MFSILGRMLGTEKALEKTIDSVSNGLDKLVYTNEEKADDAAAERSEARRMIVEWMKATQGQNLTRRVLAIAIAFVWLSQFTIAGALNIASVWLPTYSEKLIASSQILLEGAVSMNTSISIILAFYFGAMGISSLNLNNKK